MRKNNRAARSVRTSIEEDHFSVVGFVAWPLNECEAGVDLVFIETSLLFFMLMVLFSCELV